MTVEELVTQLRQAMPHNLLSAVLYGSAAAGDFVPGTSNYNVLLVVERLGVAELNALAKPVAQWIRAGHRPPLLFVRGQLQAFADVFPIELLDMCQSRRVLLGDDPLGQVAIDNEHLRLQLKRELNEKLLSLREGYLAAGGRPKQIVRLLAASVAGVLVLFRAALRLFEDRPPAAKADALQRLTQHIPFDPKPVADVHDLRHRRRKTTDFDLATLFEAYLKAIEQVAAAVNSALPSR
jgi:hypothetical protein